MIVMVDADHSMRSKLHPNTGFTPRGRASTLPEEMSFLCSTLCPAPESMTVGSSLYQDRNCPTLLSAATPADCTAATKTCTITSPSLDSALLPFFVYNTLHPERAQLPISML